MCPPVMRLTKIEVAEKQHAEYRMAVDDIRQEEDQQDPADAPEDPFPLGDSTSNVSS